MNHYRNILTLIGIGILYVGSILQAEAMDVLENPILEINRVHNAIKIADNLSIDSMQEGQVRDRQLFLKFQYLFN